MSSYDQVKIKDKLGNEYTARLHESMFKAFHAELPSCGPKYDVRAKSVGAAVQMLVDIINEDLDKAAKANAISQNKPPTIELPVTDVVVLLKQYDAWSGSYNPDDRKTYLNCFENLRSKLIDSGLYKED